MGQVPINIMIVNQQIIITHHSYKNYDILPVHVTIHSTMDNL